MQVEMDKEVSEIPYVQPGRVELKLPYLAKFQENGMWYRCSILRFITDEEVRVIFWDYGDMQDMNISDLKELPMQYMTVPKQALHVQISNDITADTLEDLKNCLGVKQIDDKGSLVLFYFERNSKEWKKF